MTPDPPTEQDRRLLAEVKQGGWTIAVFPCSRDDPGRAHTIGLYHAFCHPEVLVYGLDAGVAFALLQEIGRSVVAGEKFAPALQYNDVFDRVVTFVPVARHEYHTTLGSATRLYKSDQFPTLQCIWPDAAGRYPWEPGADDLVHLFQPVLGEPLPPLPFGPRHP